MMIITVNSNTVCILAFIIIYYFVYKIIHKIILLIYPIIIIMAQYMNDQVPY